MSSKEDVAKAIKAVFDKDTETTGKAWIGEFEDEYTSS